ncbi:MAG: hypothetical protein FD168_2328 [Desulfobulbaceae bacterium]|jgi:rRNA maturation protein Nop10|nr:MAG: hypothetical protein FD168_2328 [Desulfobulbaceae bacterium]
MTEYTEKKCPKCGQQLRIPKDIGGMLMACPTCGDTFHSDFKLAVPGRRKPQEVVVEVFELPGKILQRITRFFVI